MVLIGVIVLAAGWYQWQHRQRIARRLATLVEGGPLWRKVNFRRVSVGAIVLLILGGLLTISGVLRIAMP